VSRKWRDRTNIITVKGQMLRRDVTPKRTLSVWQPERYAATLFAERLRAAGIEVDSVLTDTVRSISTEIFRFSHRLDSIITNVNKVSDNLSAETVLKTLGAEKRGIPGSAPSGLSVVKEFLSNSGIDTTTVTLADGSGLSRYNLTSPHAVVQLLEAVYRNGTHFQTFFNSLPIAGVDGTIGHRMLGSRAEGNLRAKTGSMNGVITLSGYVRTADNELLAFSMMMQNFIGSSRRYMEVQDRIAILLSGAKRGDL
jgi:D-alanyl-D-alanine carboxypeptidase/D-alanyl-D-alanine-endopeptidase (penicillin-binding protein 4)